MVSQYAHLLYTKYWRIYKARVVFGDERTIITILYSYYPARSLGLLTKPLCITTKLINSAARLFEIFLGSIPTLDLCG